MYEYIEAQLNCITSLHVGCGQDVGIVDRPFIREKVTGLPLVPGSGFRGAIRATIASNDADATARLMGAETAQAGELSAGCISVHDARLALFPVRSSPGIFRWVTCPYVLQRYARDRAYFTGSVTKGLDALPSPTRERYAGAGPDRMMLEEYELTRSDDWECPFEFDGVETGQIVLVSDEWFRHFTTNASIIAQHNRLTGQKTVKRGQLFSTESMPPESVFYGFFGATHERVKGRTGWTAQQSQAEFLQQLGGGHSTAILTLGADESTGQGVTLVSWRMNNNAKRKTA